MEVIGETGQVHGAWRVERRRGTAQELHDRAATDPVVGRTVVLQEVTSAAVVLGSTQDPDDLDTDMLRGAAVDVARRRSGGGAVLLRPGDHVWVDLVIPAGDPLADDDVERATWWVGESWVGSLGLRTGGDRVEVHSRGVDDRVAGRTACFAAVGPGEVTVAGRKVLGISQRRTRTGTRFQCIAYRNWDPQPLLSLLSERGPAFDAVRAALQDRAAAAVEPGWDVVEDFVPSLPQR